MRFIPFAGWILCLVLTAAGAPLVVDVRNPSFEESAGALIPDPGNFTVANVPQWTAVGSGLFRPDVPLGFAPDGASLVFLDAGGSVAQPLGLPPPPTLREPGKGPNPNANAPRVARKKFFAPGQEAAMGSRRLPLSAP